jgi:catechol 2,3-dioxygenase-like lactoylglutathione lyase family enzyme
MTQPAKAPSEKNALFTGGFSTFAVKQVSTARKFYEATLGLDVGDSMGGLRLKIPNGDDVFVYGKEDHEPAVFTIFNLQVSDIAAAVDDLSTRGVKFLQYDGGIATDKKGIHWGAKQGNGPNIAWFEDPSGNIFSIIEGQPDA